MADADREFQEKFDALRRKYVAGLGERLDVIEAAAADMVDASDPAVAMKAIIADTHKLAGNAPTFGFQELGEAAQKIELDCEALVERKAPLSTEDRTRIADMVRSLRGLTGESGG